MILHYGNLLQKAIDGEFDVIIHGCNCFHAMHGGIARHIAKIFPEADQADRATEFGDKNKLGTYSEATVVRNEHTIIIINAYTQFDCDPDQDNFQYYFFPKVLNSIKEKYGHLRIGMPLIGCGLAGGNEPVILDMIQQHFNDLDYKLVEIDTTRKLKLK